MDFQYEILQALHDGEFFDDVPPAVEFAHANQPAIIKEIRALESQPVEEFELVHG